MKKKNIGVVILAVVLCLFLAGSYALTYSMYKDLSDFTFGGDDPVDDTVYVRNPHNILYPSDYLDFEGSTGCGVYLTSEKDGGITLLGDEILKSHSFDIAELSLVAGTYTFSQGDYYALGDYCLKIRTNDSSDTLLTPMSSTGVCTFTLEESTDVKVVLYITDGIKLTDTNRTFYPCLVKGDKVEPFYVSEEEAAKMTPVVRDEVLVVETYTVTFVGGPNDGFKVTYFDSKGNEKELDIVDEGATITVYSTYPEITISDNAIPTGFAGTHKIIADKTFTYVPVGVEEYNVEVIFHSPNGGYVYYYGSNGEELTAQGNAETINITVYSNYPEVTYSCDDSECTINKTYTITEDTTIG